MPINYKDFISLLTDLVEKNEVVEFDFSNQALNDVKIQELKKPDNLVFKVKKINLSHNFLTNLTSVNKILSFCNLQYLQELNVSYNQLKFDDEKEKAQISNFVYTLRSSKLRILDLSYNPLSMKGINVLLAYFETFISIFNIPLQKINLAGVDINLSSGFLTSLSISN